MSPRARCGKERSRYWRPRGERPRGLARPSLRLLAGALPLHRPLERSERGDRRLVIAVGATCRVEGGGEALVPLVLGDAERLVLAQVLRLEGIVLGALGSLLLSVLRELLQVHQRPVVLGEELDQPHEGVIEVLLARAFGFDCTADESRRRADEG